MFVRNKTFKKIVPLYSQVNEVLKHGCSQRVADFVVSKIGIKPLLQDVGTVAVSKAKLGSDRRSVQLQQPKLQPTPSQECLCHIPVEFSPRLATKASWFTHPVPSLLMKGKKDVQSRGELAEVFTTIDANVIPICQPMRT